MLKRILCVLPVFLLASCGGNGIDPNANITTPAQFSVGAATINSIQPLPAGWGGLGPAVVAATNQGFVIQELLEATPAFTENGRGEVYKVLGTSHSGADFLLLATPNGFSFTRWLPDTRTVGFYFVDINSPNITDIEPIRDAPAADPQFVLANNTTGDMSKLTYDSVLESWGVVESRNPAATIGSAGTVVAVEPLGGDSVLIATETSLSTAGRLILMNFSFMVTPTLIGDVGIAPRDLRCGASACVVTNNGSDTVHVIDISGATPTIATSVATGSQPLWAELAAPEPVVNRGGASGDRFTVAHENDRTVIDIVWDPVGAAATTTVRSPGEGFEGLGTVNHAWFVASTDISMLVDIIDQGGNDHFWVFSAASTSVEYQIVVADSEAFVTVP